MLVLGLFGGQIKKVSIAKMAILKELGGVIEESLFGVRLVASFANEGKEVEKFRKLTEEVRKVAH
jgi:ABC-type multidrug transport system fused ATPase/permease subunit